MKITHSGDLHIARGPRLADQQRALNTMVDGMLSVRPDLVVLGGDMVGRETPHLSHPEERAVLYPAVVRLAQEAPVLVVQGNHDDPRDLRGLEHLDTKWTITVVTEPSLLRLVTPSGLATVACLPYPTRRALLDPANRSLEESGAAAAEAIAGLFAAWNYRIRKLRKEHPDEPVLFAGHMAVGGAHLAGGEVLAGREIEVSRELLASLLVDAGMLSHIHIRQEAALRCFYAGAPWRTDFSETDAFKGWNYVQTGKDASAYGDGRETSYAPSQGRARAAFHPISTPCRNLLTLDYRYATDREDGEPRWITRPTEEAIAACKGAEVRMRLVVPETMVGGCPWDVEVTRVQRLAHRVVVERVIEPVLRVRAPGVATAYTPRQKLETYWTTLATKPTPAEREAALLCLDEVTHG